MREEKVMLQNNLTPPTVTPPLCHPVSLRSGRKSREDQMGLLPVSRKEVGTRLGVAGGQVIHSTRLNSVEKKCVQDLFSNEVLIGLSMSSFVESQTSLCFLMAPAYSRGPCWQLSDLRGPSGQSLGALQGTRAR